MRPGAASSRLESLAELEVPGPSILGQRGERNSKEGERHVLQRLCQGFLGEVTGSLSDMGELPSVLQVACFPLTVGGSDLFRHQVAWK